MVVRKKQWPKRNFIVGIILLVVGMILYSSTINSKNETKAQSTRRAAYILIGIGSFNIFLGLICYVVHSYSDNQPRHLNPINTSQIEPSIHVIAVQEPVVEVRHRYSHEEPPPSYEEVIKNSLHSSEQFLHVPTSNPCNYNIRSNSLSNHQVLPSRSPIK